MLVQSKTPRCLRGAILAWLLLALALAGCVTTRSGALSDDARRADGMAQTFSPSLVADAADADAEGEEAEPEEDDLGDPGFFRRYFPFTLNDGMAEPVDDIAVTTYLINLLPFGALWGPLVLLDDDERPDLGSDILLSWLVPALGSSGVALVFYGSGIAVMLTGGLFGGVAGMVFPPCAAIGCLAAPCGVAGICVGLPIAALGGLYIAPTATLNAWDRAYRFPDADEDGNDDGEEGARAPRGGASESEADPAPPPTSASPTPSSEPPAESYGY